MPQKWVLGCYASKNYALGNNRNATLFWWLFRQVDHMYGRQLLCSSGLGEASGEIPYSVL